MGQDNIPHGLNSLVFLLKMKYFRREESDGGTSLWKKM
jgi:hypothetical protein